MEEETKTTYDDRRKELTHVIKTVQDSLDEDKKVIGTVTNIKTGVYKEEGIRKAYKILQADVPNLEKSIKENKEKLEALKEIEEDEEVKKIKETLEKVAKLKQKEQLETQKKEFGEALAFTKKSLNEIRQAIGSRLKL